MGMIGNQPAAGVGSISIANDSFNGTGAATSFTLSQTVGTTTDIEVIVDNVQQSPYDGSYSVSGTTLTFSGAPAAGTNNIYVIYNNARTITTQQQIPDDGSVHSSKIAPNAVTDAKISAMAATKLTGAFSSSQVFPAGHVIQTVIGTSTSVVSTTSQSAQDLLSVSITPKFTTSIIVLEGYISRLDIVYNGNAYGSVYLINPSGSGITTAVAGDAGNNNANIVSVFGSHSPNSTSSQTYKLAFSTSSGATTSVSTDGQRYSLILKEIAQ